MGETTAIKWTDHTFNLVIGCEKVSPACAHCYAERFATGRMGLDVWGANKPRKRLSASYWRQPHKWQREAVRAGVRRRVFCSSMADVFEAHPTVAEERERLWPLIKETPALDWQLLTKRAEEIAAALPADFSRATYPNVWLGFTAENQEWFDRRVKAIAAGGLFALPVLWFVSCEPLLGEIDLSGALDWLGWVICGGESGPGYRPLNFAAARSLRAQCEAASVPFFFKQVGGPRPTSGGDLLDGLRLQQMPSPINRRESDVLFQV